MGCSKTPYPSREQVQRRVDSRSRAGEEGLRAYRCRRCRAWHITSQPERDFVGAPTEQEVEAELLRWLRHAAGTRRAARPATPIPVADLERWRPTRLKANSHARVKALERLVAQGLVRLEDEGTPAARVAWVLPSEEEIDSQVLHSLRRALHSRQHGNPLVVLDVEWWLERWISPVLDLDAGLRRAALERLSGRGAIYVEELGTPRARVIAVAPASA